jgi:SAM-dependent methyltransferase
VTGDRVRGGEQGGQAARDEQADQETADVIAGRLARKSIAAGDPTGWFEPLYAAAMAGRVRVPWDRNAPSPLLAAWAADNLPRAVLSRAAGARTALVVGCGLGEDAEFIASLGFDTVAFDISPSAIEAARRRFPDSAVSYRVADLLAPPARWQRAFDLVVESMTLQALPEQARGPAIARLAPLVAPAGTLIVFARGREPGSQDDGPPWSLTRPEIEAIGAGNLQSVRIDEIRDGGASTAAWRWRAEFRRPIQ